MSIAASVSDKVDDAGNLSEMLDEALELVDKINNSMLDTNSSEYQAEVKKTISLLERCTEHVNELQLFSSNEQLEEIATSEVKYLLLPALLGYLTLKLSDNERAEVLKLARIYFLDYLKRLNSYGVVKVRLPNDDDDEENGDKPDNNLSRETELQEMAQKRQEKIMRFKTLKQMESLLATMKEAIANQKSPVDDEYVRKYQIIRLKKWVALVMDEMDSLELEMKMVGQMNRPQPEQRRAASRKPMKPFIITKDALQKKVFGLGYPSRPVMSVDEFVDKKIDEGTWAFNNKAVYNNSLQSWAEDPDKKVQQDEDESARKERLLEQDNEEELQRARQWDEFKDDTKRGSGNRKNMG